MPEPLDNGEAAFPAGLLQRIEGVDAKRLVELSRLARAESGDPQAFAQSRREARAQLVVIGERSDLHEGFDVGEEAGADPRDLEQLSARDGGLQVSRERLNRTRSGLVGADLEEILAGKLEHRGNLFQHARDLPAVHDGIVERSRESRVKS